MTNITQETFKNKHMRQGSHLKCCRGVGGVGMALQVVGIMLLVVVWLLGLLTRSFMDPQNNTLFLVGGSAFTLLLVAGGILLRKKRLDGYISYFSKKNQYTTDEISILDSELSGKDVVLLGTRKKDSDIRTYYIITPHWIKFPQLTGYARRIVDIAAVWFDPKPFYKGVHADEHLFMLDSKGEILVSHMTEPFAADIIKELSKRNKTLILSRYFQYNGEDYDCQEQPEKVAELYRQYAGKG